MSVTTSLCLIFATLMPYFVRNHIIYQKKFVGIKKKS